MLRWHLGVGILLVALAAATGVNAATEYWVVPMLGDAEGYEVILGNPAAEPDQVVLEDIGGTTWTYDVGADGRRVVPMGHSDHGAGIFGTGLRITAKGDSVVTAVYPRSTTTLTSATNAIPFALLGNDYLVVTPEHEGTPSARIAIGATLDETRVVVQYKASGTAPSIQDGRLQPARDGETRVYELDAHQVLYIEAPTLDLTGTRVTSDEPLVVVAGNPAFHSALPKSSGIGYASEQMLPRDAGGRDFVACLVEEKGPSWQWSGRLVALEDGDTTVTIHGGVPQTITLSGRGAFHDFGTTDDLYVTANQDILFAQATGSTSGFPAEMAFLVPVEHWSNRLAVAVPSSEGTGHYQAHLAIAHVADETFDLRPDPHHVERPIAGSQYACSVTGHVFGDVDGVAEVDFDTAKGSMQLWAGRGNMPLSSLQIGALGPCAYEQTQTNIRVRTRVDADAGGVVLDWTDHALACGGESLYRITRTTIATGEQTDRATISGDTWVEPLAGSNAPDMCATYTWSVVRVDGGGGGTSKPLKIDDASCATLACPAFGSDALDVSLVRGSPSSLELDIWDPKGIGWVLSLDAGALPIVAELNDRTLTLVSDTAGTHTGLQVRLRPDHDACTTDLLPITVFVVAPETICATVHGWENLQPITAGQTLDLVLQLAVGTGTDVEVIITPPAALETAIIRDAPTAVRWPTTEADAGNVTTWQVALQQTTTGCPAHQTWSFDVHIVAEQTGPVHPTGAGCPRFIAPPERLIFTVLETTNARFRTESPGGAPFAIAVDGPHGMQIEERTGILTWTPRAEQLGEHGPLDLRLQSPDGCDVRHTFQALVVAPPAACPGIAQKPEDVAVEHGAPVRLEWHVRNPNAVPIDVDWQTTAGLQQEGVHTTTARFEDRLRFAIDGVPTGEHTVSLRLQESAHCMARHDSVLLRVTAPATSDAQPVPSPARAPTPTPAPVASTNGPPDVGPNADPASLHMPAPQARMISGVLIVLGVSLGLAALGWIALARNRRSPKH